jgi:hypothetical protein
VSQHMTDVTKSMPQLLNTIYAQPTTGGGNTYTPPTLGSLLSPLGHAQGGPTFAGHVYRVGEAGPEELLMPSDGYVIPHGATVKPLNDVVGGGGEPTVVQIVIDRKVVGEAVIGYVQDKAARR